MAAGGGEATGRPPVGCRGDDGEDEEVPPGGAEAGGAGVEAGAEAAVGSGSCRLILMPRLMTRPEGGGGKNEGEGKGGAEEETRKRNYASAQVCSTFPPFQIHAVGMGFYGICCCGSPHAPSPLPLRAVFIRGYQHVSPTPSLTTLSRRHQQIPSPPLSLTRRYQYITPRRPQRRREQVARGARIKDAEVALRPHCGHAGEVQMCIAAQSDAPGSCERVWRKGWGKCGRKCEK